MLFEEFQDCHHGRHLGYWNWTMQLFWISMSPRCLPSSFASTWLTVWEEVWFEEFHLEHWNRWTLAVLNFHNTPMPPIMFKLNQTYRSVADVIWRFSRWLPWWPSWISERNHLSNSKSMMPRCLPPFPLNQTYCSGMIIIEDFQDCRRRWNVVWKFSRWLTWRPSWILERNDFINS